MGARGPKPQPATVHQLRGNPSKKPLGELLGEVQPDIEIPGCPQYLLKEARKEWRRITPELAKLGLIAKIDRAALALYCQAWAWMVYHEEQLQRSMELAGKQREAFEAKEAARTAAAAAAGEVHTSAQWAGGDGFMLPTPNGSFTYSPHWVAKNKASEQVDKFLANFGMSPSSRSRVTASDQYPYLPGMGPAEAPPGKVASLVDFAAR